MPIEGILDLQRRGVPLGEIRIGTSVEATSKAGKAIRKPVRLETFRFTTASEHIAKVVAAKYGGTVAPWSQRKGRWEVITNRTALDVWVPPRGGAVDANMELWDGPKRLRKCNGIIESLSGQPCQCPRPNDPSDPVSVQQARDERKRLAALRPPQACKPLTRINVTIPDLPGLTGVFKLNTGSENAAVETADSGDAMVIAREGGVYLPAVLRFEWRNRATDGSPYPVPVLEIGRSMQELAEGALPAGPSGLLAQLQGSTGREQRAALTAGASAAPAQAPEPDGFDADLAAITEMDIATAGQQTRCPHEQPGNHTRPDERPQDTGAGPWCLGRPGVHRRRRARDVGGSALSLADPLGCARPRRQGPPPAGHSARTGCPAGRGSG